ncbi:MAG: hypothetical protein KatS3mg124_2175 [Porticoccaceae bacterium]|nr:MAG: hypothetical protein KatS3mg124_2175 [Porticoccaceae bacterium]
MGQSTGGAILAKHLLARHRAGEAAELARVVLLAPLVAPAGWWYNRLLYLALRRFRRRLRRVPGAGSSDPAFRELLRRDPLQARALPMAWIGAMDRWIREVKQASPCPWPVRILQGTADATLAWRYNLRVLRKVFPAAQIQLLPGVRHHMVNERPALREQVFAALGL